MLNLIIDIISLGASIATLVLMVMIYKEIGKK